MNSTVKVTANPLDNSVFQKGTVGKDGKQYGYIRVESVKHVNNGGFLKPVAVSALVPMSEADFNRAPLTAGQDLGGKIRIIESLTQTPGAKAKLAGDSQIPCTIGGKQIYRKTEWTMDLSLQDVLLAHDNGEAIKAAIAKKSANING